MPHALCALLALNLVPNALNLKPQLKEIMPEEMILEK
jgi:hypothetical protein